MKCNPRAVCKGAIVFEKEKWDRVRASFEQLWARADLSWSLQQGKGLAGRDRRQKVKWRKRHWWKNQAGGGMEAENKRK